MQIGLSLAVGSVAMMGARGTPAAPVIQSVEIEGSGEAGDPHTLVIVYDDPQPYPPPTRTITWKRDGVTILGETGSSYTPLDTYALTATVSVSNSEGSAGPETTAAVNLTPGYTSDPVISTATSFEVGEELTVSTPTTIGQVSSVTYRWKRDGVQIATGNVYTIAEADVDAEITAEVLITGANGTTVAIADPVFIGGSLPTVSVTDITDAGFTDITVYTVAYTASGETSVVIQWYSAADPDTILATGNDVTFATAVADLKCKVTATNDAGSAFDESDETAVVQQAAAPSGVSATIDKDGETVDPGTTLTAIVTATGSPAVFAITVQWTRDGSPITDADEITYTTTVADAGAAITYTYEIDNGVSPPATGTSGDSVTVSAAAPSLTGVPDVTRSVGAAVYTDDMNTYGTNVDGLSWSLDLAANAALALSFETGDFAFVDYSPYFPAATQWTATGVSQSTNPFSGTPAALPTGFANSEQPGVLRIADTVADGAYSVKFWGGDGSSALSIAATLTGAAPGAVTIPPAPPDNAWDLQDNGDGSLSIVVISPFPNGGSANTDREYDINEGTPVSFGVTGNGTFLIPASSLTVGQEASVRVRSVNAEGDGDWSAPKTETPTGATAPFTLTITDDFPVWTGTGLASLTVTDNFPIWSAS